ncbi:MAG TPA: pantetheine-phosphate adenylyltransferase [Elusimicrobiales bacterium]|nr:pantetheine-phosphate adenylyltransferase [Elusimicrobiales bacterium]
MKRIAVYPGSFDPVTNGHMDIIRRASGIFSEVVVAVLHNRGKKPLFTPEERLALIRANVKNLPNVRVDSFSGLLADYMKKNNISVAIRGLRAVSDLEYEFQIAHTNRSLYKKMETVFLMPSDKYVYLSSSMVREVASLGGNLSEYIPANVAKALAQKRAEGGF